MALSIFTEKLEKPEKANITEVLGSTEMFWNGIIKYIIENYPGTVDNEWKFYSKKSGWNLLIKHQNRTILYMFPNKDYFSVLFVLGEKAVLRAFESSLPPYIIEKVESAKPYAEGRSFNFEVRNEQDMEFVKILINIKMNN